MWSFTSPSVPFLNPLGPNMLEFRIFFCMQSIYHILCNVPMQQQQHITKYINIYTKKHLNSLTERDKDYKQPHIYLLGPGCQLNYKQAFSLQSLLESDEGLRSCCVFGVSQFCMSQIATSLPNSNHHPHFSGRDRSSRVGWPQSQSRPVCFQTLAFPCTQCSWY